jgi:hypothetical protein
MVRIFIENQELDVKDDFSHQITYAVDDLKNLDSKSTAFSKTIVLPGTANNNKLLGNIFEFANANFNVEGSNVGYNFNAAKSAKARIEVNGLTIIKGVLRLLEVIVDSKMIEYEVAIFGELGGLFNKLGTSKLEDLDFSDYNHTYNTTNIKNSWALPKTFSHVAAAGELTFIGKILYIYNFNFSQLDYGDSIVITGASSNNGTYVVDSVFFDPLENKTIVNLTTTFPSGVNTSGTVSVTKSGIGYYYPLIDYGNVSTNKKDYQYKAFRPAIFVKDIISRIIKNAGYSWESNFFKTNFFSRLIIPNNDAKFYRRDITNLISYTLTTDQRVSSPTGSLYLRTNTLKLAWNTGTLVNFTLGSSGTTFTYTGTSTHLKLDLRVKGIYRKETINDYFSIQVYQNGVSIFTKSDVFNGIGNEFGFDTTLEVESDFVTNDTIYIEIKSQTSFANTPPLNYNYIEVQDSTLSAYIYPPALTEYVLGETVDMKRIAPLNVFQKDFFASVLKMFNLMVTEDKYVEKKLIIEPWVDFYDLDRTTYLDWSNKIDRSNVIKIKPMSEINARYYQLKYKSDNDYYNELYKKKYNEGYGDVNFDNALEFAKDSSTTEVIFSATPLVGWSGEAKIVPAIMKWDGVTKGTNEESVTSNIRIMQVKEVSGITSWNILDSGTTLASGTTYGYAGHLDNPDAPAADLNFGSTKELYFTLVAGALQNNLFNTYYSSYMAEITDKDSRLVTAKIKLTEQDIYNLDFGRFIFFDGVLYRLQRIVDYSAGDICTVELLRVIYTQY